MVPSLLIFNSEENVRQSLTSLMVIIIRAVKSFLCQVEVELQINSTNKKQQIILFSSVANYNHLFWGENTLHEDNPYLFQKIKTKDRVIEKLMKFIERMVT